MGKNDNQLTNFPQERKYFRIYIGNTMPDTTVIPTHIPELKDQIRLLQKISLFWYW